jgi:signal transduction histidine kinase
MFALLNLGLMWAFPGSETIPYHFIFVSLTVVYGFRVWPPKPTLVLLGGVTITTGMVLLVRYFDDVIALDELAEIPLMPMIFAGQVWHARRRLVAQRKIDVLAENERQSIARQREFVRDVSHAVRTPLTIARGHLELVRAEAWRPSVAEDAEVILHQLDRLERLAERLLTLEQLERLDELLAVPVDVSQFIELIGDRWTVSVDRRWHVSTTPTGLLMVDTERLELALDALIENAVKFTGPDDMISLTCETSEEFCVIEVADSGQGLLPDDLPFLFDRFWKRTRPGTSPGNGLGLSVVRAIVEAHGGTATAACRPAGGAVFSLRLPKVEAESEWSALSTVRLVSD